jgi:hypothetical protein
MGILINQKLCVRRPPNLRRTARHTFSSSHDQSTPSKHCDHLDVVVHAKATLPAQMLTDAKQRKTDMGRSAQECAQDGRVTQT